MMKLVKLNFVETTFVDDSYGSSKIKHPLSNSVLMLLSYSRDPAWGAGMAQW